MRGPTKSILLALSLACPLLHAQAQDHAKIVSDYVRASGGSKALSKIQTETLEGAFSNPADGKPSTYTFSLKLPNRYYSEFVLGDKPRQSLATQVREAPIPQRRTLHSSRPARPAARSRLALLQLPPPRSQEAQARRCLYRPCASPRQRRSSTRTHHHGQHTPRTLLRSAIPSPQIVKESAPVAGLPRPGNFLRRLPQRRRRRQETPLQNRASSRPRHLLHRTSPAP